MNYRNGRKVSPSVFQAIRYVAKVGVITRETWNEIFGKGSIRWKQMQLKFLIDQSKIFERFERGGINSSEVTGLGLGLYITNQIVSGHGGKVWVESSVGQGSTFIVEIPLYQ